MLCLSWVSIDRGAGEDTPPSSLREPVLLDLGYKDRALRIGQIYDISTVSCNRDRTNFTGCVLGAR
jgi:hypothetical protein